jgi:2-polyprenyl-3-methyl-5-hydroxy-6-metoxy-1,4-benzoquinol methylase
VATSKTICDRKFACLNRIIEAAVKVWPEHEKFLARSFAVRDELGLQMSEQVAQMTLALTDDLTKLCTDYRWTCDRLLEEEVEFRRSGRYRRTSFAEVVREVYGCPQFMSRYVNGLLLSQTLWANHAAILELFARRFLPSLPQGWSLLEVGPGHGLMLCLAALSGRMGGLTGWDVSATSIESTKIALARMNVRQHVDLVVKDILDVGEVRAFDAVVICEVIEHLERPDDALRTIRSAMACGGKLFVSVPVNSPAPDHIYLLRSPDEVKQLVERSGFAISEAHAFPMSGYTLERAKRGAMTISCCIMAEAA